MEAGLKEKEDALSGRTCVETGGFLARAERCRCWEGVAGMEEGSPVGEGCIKKDQCGCREEGCRSGWTTTSSDNGVYGGIAERSRSVWVGENELAQALQCVENKFRTTLNRSGNEG